MLLQLYGNCLLPVRKQGKDSNRSDLGEHLAWQRMLRTSASPSSFLLSHTPGVSRGCHPRGRARLYPWLLAPWPGSACLSRCLKNRLLDARPVSLCLLNKIKWLKSHLDFMTFRFVAVQQSSSTIAGPVLSAPGRS